jgi:hypothetical protein
LTGLRACFSLKFKLTKLDETQTFMPDRPRAMYLAAMHQLFQHMGYYSQVAVRAIVDEQGIDSLDELHILKDKEITNLCKFIHDPGGQIANPNPLQQGNIPNPGISVSLHMENNTKLAKWMIVHRMLPFSRPCQPGDVTLAMVPAFTEMREYELNHTNPETKPMIDDKDWPKMFKSIKQYFTLKCGELHIPLAYVIHEQVTPPPAANDPAGNYVMPVLEMIACAPHERNGKPDPVFIVSSGMVLDNLANMFHDTLSWTYMKDFVQPRDGRGTYRALFNHYFGPNNVNNQSAAMEKALATISYNGEGCILEGLVCYGYSGIDACTKVCYLMDGIKTSALDVPTG